ncbi:MAG: fused MFS/spermidine synthase [Proteobacteria bacterium]|nr:fused MFS/spermidine synthase [Pseudomonadota bacterium]
MTPVFALFLIIFFEGYVVLSTELLAIRLLLPFTGSGTDTISIIIAAILMPLAFGYYAGGKFKTKKGSGQPVQTVRDRLILNLVVAAAILTPGLSYAFLDAAFNWAYNQAGWNNRIWLTTGYSLLFLVVPVFLLGQTVPLISNYFSRERLPVMAGKILFFSTLGSFMGAIFCTLVLMSFLGVNNTVIITIACIAALTFMLSKRKISGTTITVTACLALSALLNSPAAMRHFDIARYNEYNMIQIVEHEGKGVRSMRLNRTFAAAVQDYVAAPIVPYAAYIEQNFIRPLYNPDARPRDILILGAGGFTVGRFDDLNNYTFVDIDDDLKEIAEDIFLKEDIGPNKQFVPMEARAFLNQTREKYDLIVLDLYRDPVSVPEYLITKEFFEQTKNHLKDGGIVAGNYFASATFSDYYSLKLDNTLRTVFPAINRQIIQPYDSWDRENDWINIIYSYVDTGIITDGIYTDNKNTSMFEKPVIVRAQPND